MFGIVDEFFFFPNHLIQNSALGSVWVSHNSRRLDINLTNFGQAFCHHNYIPLHAVLKDNSLTTKLRKVFDAFGKTDKGVSIDILLKGPCIQDELVFIMTRIKAHKFN